MPIVSIPVKSTDSGPRTLAVSLEPGMADILQALSININKAQADLDLAHSNFRFYLSQCAKCLGIDADPSISSIEFDHVNVRFILKEGD